MPRRTPSQRIGSLGHRVAAAQFERLGSWIVRNQEEDVGIDMEVELCDPDPTADFLKCQIKSFEGAAAKRPVRLKNGFLKYACECRIPVILVLVESITGQSWFCWLQGCIEANRLRPSIYGARGSTTIAAEWLAPLDGAGNVELKLIARGVHPIARATHVRDLVRFALETHDHELVGAANRLLARYQKEISYFPIDLVLDEVLSLGNRIWATVEGNALAELLYMLARSYGGQFNLDQIRKLVVRGEGYSRTGINALSIMYDEFPERMKTLKLGEEFERHNDWRVSYFCKLREKHSGVPVMALITRGHDCAVDGRDLHSSAREQGLSKWANRGDCAILDFAYQVD
ncbi:DUF4365 domain-containing protein [Bradyrhizobium yuanmingense]|uniref:DUF4365 domain-containing protein n=1 Tax=Bradyrhizobium yuanmingense TaxID=108015 RepID=UPI0021A63DEB|nr:DUF4365 domain-containing protein [Bradyrhizobium sp. CB1024]UWU86108.1 DUF4365 domain-containing protein [Bradyrhizobium sp. CB1024]